MVKTIYKFKDIGKVITGKTPPTSQLDLYGDVCSFITPSDIPSFEERYLSKTERGLSEKGLKKMQTILLPKDSIGVVCIGSTIGKICLTKEYCITNQQLNSIIVNRDKFNPMYIYYAIRNYIPKIKAITGGTGSGKSILNKTSFEELEIKLHNEKNIQDKIARVLSNYDDLIENNNKRIKILEEMAQKIYKEWFVDFKFPNYETATFKQTDLGKIPTDWEVVLANQIADIYIGRTPSRKDFDCFTTCNKDKKWVSIKDIGLSNEFIFDTSEYLTEDAIKKYNVPLIPKDTVILSFKLTVGKVTITTEEMTSNEAIAQFQTKDKEQIPTNYLYLYLKNFEYNNLGNTSSIGNAINSTIVKNMPILVPSREVAQKFNENIINIFNEIKNLTLKNTNLKQTRDLLLPRLISGEIDVENMEIK